MSTEETRSVTCCIDGSRTLGLGEIWISEGRSDERKDMAAYSDELGGHQWGAAGIGDGLTRCAGRNLREGRHKRRWQDDIKVDLGETRWHVLG